MREHFLKLKSNLEFNQALTDQVSTKHNAVRDYVKNNNTKVKDSKLIGSLQRKTRIHPGTNGKIDIDIVVIMGEFYNWVSSGGVSPQDALTELHSTVADSDRYGGKDLTMDAPTVSLTYEDGIEVQLVPAYLDNIGYDPSGNYLGPKGRGYWVVKNGKWELADYDHEAEYISALNTVSDGYFIPTIKMLKAIKRTYFSDLDSFPLEIIASRIIPSTILAKKRLGIQIDYHDLLQDFFEKAPIHLSTPLQIPDSKSPAITLDPLITVSLKSTFDTIANYIRSINAKQFQGEKIEMWRKVIGDAFPVTI
jgi:hypothetical protein